MMKSLPEPPFLVCITHFPASVVDHKVGFKASGAIQQRFSLNT